MNHLEPQAIIALGDGYASTTVNTAIFRHHGVVTRDDFQFTAWYADENRMVLARRDLRDDSVTRHEIAGAFSVHDAHCVISLGIDPAGHIHVSYDHHNHPLRYRRSVRPLDITEWSEPRGMTGVGEGDVTYPYFVMWPRDADDREHRGPLDFLYRDGKSGNGDLWLKRYDAERDAWTDLASAFLKGTEQTPWTTNAYWNHPAFDAEGRLVLTWVWRVHQPREPMRKFWYNLNVGYARSADGAAWESSLGLPMNLPMTPVNAEVIHPVSPGCNLMNQCSSAVDGRGRLHVVFYAGATPDAPPQFQHLWQSDRGWRCDPISDRAEPFALQGRGSLAPPISRPEIVIDDADRVYVLYRGDVTDDRLVAQRLDPPDYAPPGETFVLWDESLAMSEPIIDRVRWARDRTLTVLVQKANKKRVENSDTIRPEPTETPVYLADWHLG